MTVALSLAPCPGATSLAPPNPALSSLWGSHSSLPSVLPPPAEEEINNMKSELEKYGIQMPAFSKIGGILANELSVDEAACERVFRKGGGIEK